MGIKIYTYSNPYEIDCESFWNEIRDCAHFCVSQTMVNGMSQTYPLLKTRQATATIRTLVNMLYENWEDINTNVRQIMEVDNAISELDYQSPCLENVKRSLLFNTKSIVSCIRMFKELGIDSRLMSKEELNIDQRYLVELYKIIDKKENSSFCFDRVESQRNVEKAIDAALLYHKENVDLNEIDRDRIVIHGIHQFTPAMLCAIEDISKYKEVVLLFNYQKQYASVYDTWMNIYSIFDLPINNQSVNQFVPMPLLVNSYKSNVLADYLGHLSNGEFIEKNKALDDLEVVEFDNTTEFANYVAMLFDKAKKVSEKNSSSKTPLAFMEEQLYSASGKVNDILRAYFPEQFGERHFLDYPIGHFFVSTTNMWDSENRTVKVENFSDIKECLNSGIINENNPGQLVSTFNMIEPYIEKENTISGIISKLNQLIKNANKKHEDKDKVGYFTVELNFLQELKKALGELEYIINSFFEDFDNGSDNFRRFYKRIRKFIISHVGDLNELDDEMHSVIGRLLERLEKSDLPETGTFNSLKHTMSYYLSQDENTARGAHWIVRNFDQIDGDILRSASQDPERLCYHFCCLSDKDICSGKDERLPWPLDIKFFEYSYQALDMKYQVFLKSKMEYRNFKRYALVYGLEFNRVGCKLSYVRTEENKDNDLFYMLNLLGVKIRKYSSFNSNNYLEHLSIESDEKDIEEAVRAISSEDKKKLKLCQYRFALEGIEQGKTIFRDRFLIHTYLKILISNRTKKELNGKPYNDITIRNAIQEQYDVIETRFRISDELEKTQIISAVYKDIYGFINYMKKYNKNTNAFPVISSSMGQEMRLREHFLNISLKGIMEEPSDEELKEAITDKKFYCVHGKHCMYCASKDICLEYGANFGGE
ncbi:MAG: hypothetical protein HDT39_06020 [Lachnospiraceae bacterium]|nr:hypothetical protein [Lachnospiraceae bacterium]